MIQEEFNQDNQFRNLINLEGILLPLFENNIEEEPLRNLINLEEDFQLNFVKEEEELDSEDKTLNLLCVELPEKDEYLRKKNHLSEFFLEEDKAEARANLGITPLLAELLAIIEAKLVDETGNLKFGLEPTDGIENEEAYGLVLSSAIIYKVLQRYYTKTELDNQSDVIFGLINELKNTNINKENVYTKEEVDNIIFSEEFNNKLEQLAAEKVNYGLATVARTGNYTDLINTPTKVSLFFNDSKYLKKEDIIGESGFISDIEQLREQAEKGLLAYDKFISKVEIEDLSYIVQAILYKAESAYQLPETGIPRTDLSENVLESLHKADTAVQDISGKQDIIQDLETIRQGAILGSTAYQLSNMGIPKNDLSNEVLILLDKANTAYLLPVTGIPKTNLDSNVLSTLEKVDSAYQLPQDGIPKSDLSLSIQNLLDKADTINTKADKVSGATNGNFAGLDANGNIIDSGHKHADYKTKLSSVSDPAVDGYGLTFIDSISQNTNGVITPHKKTIQSVSKQLSGIMSSDDKIKLDSLNIASSIDSNNSDLPTTSQIKSSILDLIPLLATISNQLADKEFVNSSIATATADFKGTYNLKNDLGLNISSTQSNINTKIKTKVSSANNNDYVFILIPTDNNTPTEISHVDRYKYNGTNWIYEFTLNNSSFTAALWAAINSGITSTLVSIVNNLSNVATSGSYSDLSDKPTIPVVNNAKLTIQKNGTTITTFTANASSNVTANIEVPTKVSDLENDLNFNNYSLPLAASGTRGGVQIGYSESNSGTSSSRNYAVKLSSEKMYVNVPWANTTYTFATGDANGQIKVTPSGGSAQNIDVKGLKALAYKASLVASDIPDLSSTYATTGRVTTLEGYFTSGIANNADKLDGAHGSEFYTLSKNNTTAINTGDDLNDYTTAGTFTTTGGKDGSTVAASLLNKPTFNGGFRIYVAATNPEETFIYQHIITYGGRVFDRFSNGSKSFTDTVWRENAYLDSTVAQADRLSGTGTYTAWGQTYWKNGVPKGNVSGNMSSVGNISFSASGKHIGSIAYFDTTNSRLGVNISNPSYALHVAGTFRASGDSTIGGTLGVSGLLTASGGITIPSDKTLTIGDAVISWDVLSGYATQSWVNAKGYVTSSGVTSITAGTGLAGGTITDTGTISISSTYRTYISNGNTAYGWGNHADAGYVKSSGVTSITLKAGAGISLDVNNTAITSTGTRTITNSGVRSTTINGNYLRVNTNGTDADLTIPYATSAAYFLAGEITSSSTSGDADTMQLNGAGTVYSVLTNYTNNNKWQNMPLSGNNYGGVVEIKGNHAYLKMQLAWAALHDEETVPTTGLWFRARANKGYVSTDWHQVAMTDSNVASATKLQTTRTIWGQDFDGTANISGPITGATTISASSDVSVGGTLDVTGNATISGILSTVQQGRTVTSLSTSGSASSVHIDASKGDIFTYNINRNCYVTISNFVAGQIIYLIVANGSTSNTFTISFDNLHPPASGTMWITNRRVDGGTGVNSTIDTMQLTVFLLIVLESSIIVRYL